MNLEALPAEKREGGATDAFSIVAGGRPVGTLHIKAFKYMDYRLGRVVYAWRSREEPKGAFAVAYGEAARLLDLDLLRSDYKVSDAAWLFWSRLRPPEGYLRFSGEWRGAPLSETDPDFEERIEEAETVVGDVVLLPREDFFCLARSKKVVQDVEPNHRVQECPMRSVYLTLDEGCLEIAQELINAEMADTEREALTGIVESGAKALTGADLLKELNSAAKLTNECDGIDFLSATAAEVERLGMEAGVAPWAHETIRAIARAAAPKAIPGLFDEDA